MNWSARFSWLMALRAGRETRSTRHDDDPDMADMGTAFGLDASFDAVPASLLTTPQQTGVPPTLAAALESRLIRRSRL